MPRYKITITTDGSNIGAIQKACKAAFGQDISYQAEKIQRGPSRADRLSDAEGLVAEAKGIVEELKDEMDAWKEGMPENLQNSDKASEVDDAVSELESLYEALDGVSFDGVTFPGMF